MPNGREGVSGKNSWKSWQSNYFSPFFSSAFAPSFGRKQTTTHSMIFIMPFPTHNNIQALIDAHLMMLFASFQLRRDGRRHFHFVRSFRFRAQILRRMFECHRHWPKSSNTFIIFFFSISALRWQLNSVFDIYGIDRRKSNGYDNSYRCRRQRCRLGVFGERATHSNRFSTITYASAFIHSMPSCVSVSNDWVLYVAVGASISGHNVPTAWQIRLTGYT